MEQIKPEILTKTKVIKTISRVCPNLKIDAIKFLGEGDSCRAYLVNHEWIFRFAKHDAARASLQCENCLLPQIAGKIALQIPSPQIVSLEETETPFIAYPLLPGRVLSQKRYLALDEQSRARCAGQVAQFLNQIHSINIDLAQSCRVPFNDYKAQYSGLPKLARENLSAFLSAPDFKFIEKVVARYLASGDAESFRPTLLHGDLSPNHVLFDEKTNRVSGIIDFGDMMIGDAAWDLIWIYEDYGSDFLSRLLDVYHESDRKSLLRRVRQFLLLQAIEWAIDCQASGDDDLAEAVEQLVALRIEAENFS
ncbi:MAG: phosphotransferase family protein [Pyrinomonadaceae bacterium]